MRVAFGSWVLGLCCLSAVACTSTLNAASGAGSLAGAAYKGAARATTDPSITFAIKSAMINDDLVRARDINVDTDEGVVTLRGTQASPEAIDRAEQLAWRARGVVKVINLIRIEPPGSLPAWR